MVELDKTVKSRKSRRHINFRKFKKDYLISFFKKTTKSEHYFSFKKGGLRYTARKTFFFNFLKAIILPQKVELNIFFCGIFRAKYFRQNILVKVFLISEDIL